ncbi:MAG: T9SS type A sorting domain-containing protein [Flavobacteriales bacterium]|nr:T9SS type A sorting domain-containing protein [Flavobacteriales bacterium]
MDNDQNVIVTGVTHNGSNEDFYTIKYDPSGNILWEIAYNNLDNGDDNPFDIVVDEDGDIIISGQSKYPNTFKHVSVKYREVYVINPLGTNEIQSNASFNLFTTNYGQLLDVDGNFVDQIKFSCYDESIGDAFLSDTSITYVKRAPSDLSNLCAINLKPKNSNDTKVIGRNKAHFHKNFYLSHLPHGKERVPNYNSVIYPDIWRDIDLEIIKGNLGLDYYFILNKGASISSLKLDLDFHDQISVDPNTNQLIIETACDQFELAEPFAYQIQSDGQITNLGWTPAYSLNGDEVSFTIGSYDTNKPLIISIANSGGSAYDEAGLCWSTYFSASGNIQAETVTHNADNDVFGGANMDEASNFTFYNQITSEYNLIDNTNANIFKVDEDYSPEWMTIYGDQMGYTYINDLEFKEGHGLYCVGATGVDNFVVGGIDEVGSAFPYNGAGPFSSNFYDGFIFKLGDASGQRLWSTYLGSEGTLNEGGADYAKNVIVSTTGKVYVSGVAGASDFENNGEGNLFNGGLADIFLSEFNENDELLWTWFFGGSNKDYSLGLDEDDQGNIWLHGSTNSNDFMPINPNPGDNNVFFQQTNNGGVDDLIIEFDPVNSSTIYSSYLGGNEKETGLDFALQHTDLIAAGNGKVYVAGRTKSDETTFPLLSDGGNFNYQQNDLGSINSTSPSNGYIFALDKTNYHQEWGTYFNDADNNNGSDANNFPRTIFLKSYANDTPDKLVVVGQAAAPNEIDNPGFLTYTSNPSGLVDGFVYIFTAGLSTNNLSNGTLFGGEKYDWITDVSFIEQDHFVVTGSINTDNNEMTEFPLDDSGGSALFSDQLYPIATFNRLGFFSAFCDEGIITSNSNLDKLDAIASIFPNPFSEGVNVVADDNNLKHYTIFDISGRTIKRGFFNNNKTQYINLNDLTDGIYILEIETVNKEQVQIKIVKQ